MAWHARLSASQTKDWANCPGTIPLKEYFPYDDPSGPAAQLGTCAHQLIEECLGKGLPPSAYEHRLIEIKHPDTDREEVVILPKSAKWPKDPKRVVFEVDEDMIEATTTFIDYVLGRLAELFPETYDATGLDDGVDYAWGKQAFAKGTIKLETRVNPLPERDDTGGTVDVTIDAWPELLEVVDYKNGTGVLVPVKDNWQLRSYTLGRAVEHSADLGEYEKYRYTIGQPRHHRAPPSGTSSEELTPAELGAFRRELQKACERVDAARALVEDMFQASAEEGSPPPDIDDVRQALYRQGHLSVGEDGSHCTYCPHINDCPAARSEVEETVAMDFDDEPGELEPPLGPNHLAAILPWKPFIENFLKRAAARAEELALEGKMPGYKMVRKGGNRTWKPDLDEATVRDRLVSEYGVDPAKLMTEPTPPKLKTGPQVEKLVPSKRRKEFDAEFLHKPDGGLTMVPESDGRDAVLPGDAASAAQDFDDVED